MKRALFFIIILIFPFFLNAQNQKIDSVLEANIFKLSYDKMMTNKSIWFNGKKYIVIGMYCIFKDSKGESFYKKINANGGVSDGYQLFRFSEMYLLPISTAPRISTDFDNAIVVEISELISSEKRKLNNDNNMTLFKREDGKYYYRTYDTPYYIIKNGVKSPKIYSYTISKDSVIKTIVYKKYMKVKLKNNKTIKIDRTSFLWNNGVILL